MTDKERIRAEIARINLYSRSEVLENILKFIDSLPEEPVSEDLDEASRIKAAFKAGAELQRQQIMKHAIEGLVICDEKLTQGYRDIVFKFPDNLQVGDKVKLIIIKEEGK